MPRGKLRDTLPASGIEVWDDPDREAVMAESVYKVIDIVGSMLKRTARISNHYALKLPSSECN